MSIKKYDQFCELLSLYDLSGKQVAALLKGYLGNRVFDDDLLEYVHYKYKDFTHAAEDEELATICDHADGSVLAARIFFEDGTSKVCLARDVNFHIKKDAVKTDFFKIKIHNHDELSFDSSDRLWISRDDTDNLLDEFTFYTDNGETRLVSGNSIFFAYEMQETISY